MKDESSNRLRILGEVFPTGQRPVDPSVIYGREDYLLDAIRILDTRGQCPVIFGPKGIGKSTLVWQIELIVKEDRNAARNRGFVGLRETPNSYYETFRLTCSRLGNGQAVLNSIAEHLRRKLDWIEAEGAREKEEFLEKYSSDGSGISMPVLSSGNRSQKPDEPSANSAYEEIFNLAPKVSAGCSTPLLFILDDLDAVDDTGVITSFLKDACWNMPDELRFVLAGTAIRPGDLLEDLPILDGIAKWIELKQMESDELLKMLKQKAARLAERGLTFEFEPGIFNSIAMISAGHPSRAVQLARDSIRAAENKRDVLIARVHLDAALRDLIGAMQPSASARRRPLTR